MQTQTQQIYILFTKDREAIWTPSRSELIADLANGLFFRPDGVVLFSHEEGATHGVWEDISPAIAKEVADYICQERYSGGADIVDRDARNFVARHYMESALPTDCELF